MSNIKNKTIIETETWLNSLSAETNLQRDRLLKIANQIIEEDAGTTGRELGGVLLELARKNAYMAEIGSALVLLRYTSRKV